MAHAQDAYAVGSVAASLEPLHIPCIFCNAALSPQDIFDFNTKQLKLLNRNGQTFACCARCLRLSVQYESQYYTCSVVAGNLSDLLGAPLCKITVRCEFCMGLLTEREKLEAVDAELYFHLVRGWWRGPCRQCRLK